METSVTNATLRALRRILRASDRGERKLAAATGMAPSQLLVLQEVGRRGETTPSIVASTLQFGQPTVTSIVDRLAAAGYLTRQRGEDDRRKILLRATESGQAIIEAAPNMLQERFREQFAALEPWEQAMILSALERLGSLLGAEDIDAAPLIETGAIDQTADHDKATNRRSSTQAAGTCTEAG